MKSKINRGEDPKDSPNSGKGINANPESSHRTSASTFAIVGIGASAGGLQALEDFLKRVPSDSGLAFGVILAQKIARDEGTLLYPFWQDLAAMLNDPNNFFRSIAIQILASLCPIDQENKFESITDDYFAHLHSGSIMTIRYLIQSTSAIFLAKSSLRPYLMNILLHIEKQVNLKPERIDLLRNYILIVFEEIWEKIDEKEPLIEFAEKAIQVQSPKNKKTSQGILKKI